ncbi:hypothetical protein [Bradyrhizobium sp.]|uniref:hypothetical protein n=1 Tax=Bradyrhizobium sp. TaxID=376 RepID=UPI000A63401C
MTLQISRRRRQYLETAQTLLRAARTMVDSAIAYQLKALADDHLRRAEKASQVDAGLTAERDPEIGCEMRNHLWRATLVVLALMASNSTIGRARAHDYQHPELNSWYESLRSGKGLCCDGSDAKRVDDADWETKDGHYRVRIDGVWVDVPNDAVVDGPNRAGRAMVWPYNLDGHPKTRCFMPGSMG